MTTTVPGVNDDAQCSLQEAIYSANLDSSTVPDAAHPSDPNAYVTTGCAAGNGDDTLVLPAGGVFTMQVPAADVLNYLGPTATPMVTTTIVIEGNGARIVHGGGPSAYRAFAVGRDDDGFGVGGDLTLHEVHIKGFEVHGGNGAAGGGGGMGAGGAVYVMGGSLSVGWSTFEQNGAIGGNGGAGNQGAGGGGGGLGGNGGGAELGGGGGGGGSMGNGGPGEVGSCGSICPGGSTGGGGGGTYYPAGQSNGGDKYRGGYRCGGDGSNTIVGVLIPGARDGESGDCAGGGGGGGQEAFAIEVIGGIFGGDGGAGNYGGGGGGGAYLLESGSGGHGGFGGGGGGANKTESNFSGKGPGGGDGGFAGGGGGAAGGFLPIIGGSPGEGGTFGGDAGQHAGGGGGGLGGAIFGDQATITIRNTTFFNNYANRGHTGGTGANDGRDSGGAIFLVAGSLVVNNSTFNNNHTTGTGGLGGGAIAVYEPAGEAATLVLRNSILASNGPHECYGRNGAAMSGIGNLIVDSTANDHGDGPCPGVTETGDPQLGPLQLNFPGKTPTMAIPLGSPASGAADPLTSEPDDQRGIARPQGVGHDMGAFEAGALDVTAPTASPTQSPAANGNGWNSSDVTVSWHWADEIGGSGIDPANCTGSTTSSGEGAAIGLTATCKDLAGNTGSASYTVNVDKTPPSLSPTLSASPVVVGQSGVTASPNATDALSGVASSSCGAVDTSTPGVKTLTCSATDKAGNTGSANVGYVVEYRILGFFDPVPGSKWKVSSTVPVKIALGNAGGVRVSDAVGQALAAACRVKFSASGGQSEPATCMKYDLEKNQFVYSWKLEKTGTGVATIRVTIGYPGTAATTQKTLQITITK